MAKNQGLNNLTRGYSRSLNKAELERKYLFISMDKEVKKILSEPFKVYFNGIFYDNRSLDKYGRISGLKNLVEKFENDIIFIKINDNQLHITCDGNKI